MKILEGQIKVDNYNVKDIKLSTLRSLMGVVSQESILFNENVFHNIAFGDNNVDKENAIEAAKMANAHDFIMS
mgnify:CR=1 FL=1